MLPSAYTLRENGTWAEYDADLARNAIHTFWKSLPDGREDYIEGIRRMHSHLYARALSGTDAQIFLDKTPRYYLILSELKEIFPKARFILLVRNPLAVLSSIIRTWVQEQWLKIGNFKCDLLEAPQLLLEAQSELGENVATVRYEDLVRNSKSEVSRLCEHLGIEFHTDMIEYSESGFGKWRFGDPESVYERQRPQTSSLEKWQQPANAQEWRLLREYAEMLGKEGFDSFGYNYKNCVRMLDADQPDAADLRYTVSLEWLMERDGYRNSRWLGHGVEMLTSMRRDGLMSVVSYLANRAKNRFS